MSLREMHEQQKQSSPREQLQELNRQSRTELENSLLKEALAMSSENCEELMKQSNQEQVRAEQNRQRDAEQNRKLISELKQSVELLKNSNELLQDAISDEVGSLKDEVKENTVQEVRKALQANIEAIQRATKLLEKQSDTLTSVMKQKIRELEESKNSFFRYEGLKLYLFWGGMVCNILVFLMLLYGMTQTSHTENIPYALINQLELNVESHSRTLLCTQTTHPKSGQIVQESFQERFDQQDF